MYGRGGGRRGGRGERGGGRNKGYESGKHGDSIKLLEFVRPAAVGCSHGSPGTWADDVL